MSNYNAPLEDMMFSLKTVTNWQGLQALPGHEEFGDDLAGAVLDEAANLARDVLAPLNKVGDEQGASLNDGEVKTAEGFREAYAQYRDAGWNSLPFPEEFGGQNLPWTLSMAVNEMWQASNMSFGLCPLLNQGAVDAIEAYASQDLQAQYLPKMVSGEWTGTMNLTEPQAGSDLGHVKTKAEKSKDGDHYLITGQKIYITYGEHDMADNIIHLVLARLPDAPEGVKGISLFIVPKFLVNDDGSLGARNDLECVGLEHKLGIHASPTCTMQFGDNEGAVGYLVGEENQGLVYMFKMMNNARLHVGLQGVAIAERAYQHALSYANERKQGTTVKGEAYAPIKAHPDVIRMLMTMKALTEAGRALTYFAGSQMDFMVDSGDNETSKRALDLCDLLTPIVKAWGTDVGNQVASLGVQVHGGMGFVEETGAAQYMRDARILPIYEGTNGIQAKDLVFRKILKQEAPALKPFCDEIKAFADSLEGDLGALGDILGKQADKVVQAVYHLVEQAKQGDLASVEAASYPLLCFMGYVFGGYFVLKKAAHAQDDDALSHDFKKAKMDVAIFYWKQIAPYAEAEFLRAMNSDDFTQLSL